MKQEDNLERIEELVNKGILFQREGKHKEAVACFDQAISMDTNMNGEPDSNLLLLKNNSKMKLWVIRNVFVVVDYLNLQITNAAMKLV